MGLTDSQQACNGNHEGEKSARRVRREAREGAFLIVERRLVGGMGVDNRGSLRDEGSQEEHQEGPDRGGSLHFSPSEVTHSKGGVLYLSQTRLSSKKSPSRVMARRMADSMRSPLASLVGV